MLRKLGKYQLLEKLGEGGMAEVYAARMVGAAGFEKDVVVKLILDHLVTDSQFVEMFLDEGRLAAHLTHANICQTFDLGSVDGSYYMAIERVTGHTLRDIDDQLIETGRSMPLPIALRIVSDLLEALHYAHNATHEGKPLNIVHRDISPGNVMVTEQGTVKLLDFGIARAAIQKHRTDTGTLRGNPGFMAPEQCGSGPIDGRVDIFSCGAILYLLSTGRRAYHFEHGRTTFEALAMMAAGSFIPPRKAKPDISKELELILVTAMAAKPVGRYADAGSMLDAIDKFSELNGRATPREVAAWMKDLFESTGPKKALPVGRQVTMGTPATTARENDSDPAVAETKLKEGVMSRPPLGQLPEMPTVVGPPPEMRTVMDSDSLDSSDTGSSSELPTDDANEAPAAPTHEMKPLKAKSAWDSGRPIAIGLVATVAGMLVTLFAVRQLRADESMRVPPPIPVPRVVQAPPVPPPVVEEKNVPPEPDPVATAEEPAAEEESTETASKAPKGRKNSRVGNGILVLDTYPWARARLGENDLGTTPLRASLPPGTHKITLENPTAGIKRELTVNVKSGKTTSRYESLTK